MQYCIYLRKSRADSENEYNSDEEVLARHERTLLELAKKKKLNIITIHREVVSGETIASRPVMQQLLSEVEQGLWNGVLVMEVERLARGDTVDQGIMAQTFKFSDTKIITPMKIYDPNNEFDEEYFEFGLFMSRREYKVINRRLQRGRMASIEEGKFVANIAPYGYIRKKLEGQKGFTLEEYPEQSQVVKLIYELFVKGILQEDGVYQKIGTSLIARKLNDLKIPPLKGKSWVPTTIRGILTNPTYIGKIRWNHRKNVKKMIDGKMEFSRPRNATEQCTIVKGLHKAIIDENVWNAAQDILKNGSTSPIPKGKTIKNPLAGLVICGKCGRKMLRRPYTLGKHPDTLYCPPTDCDNVSCELSIVENTILESLKGWLDDYKLKWNTMDKTKNKGTQIHIKKKALQKLNEEAKTLDGQFDNLHNLLEQGVYSTEIFLERSKILTERINQVKKDQESINKELQNEITREESQKNIIPKVETVLEAYSQAETALQKNNLLKEVLEKVVYTKNVNGRWHNRPDDFEIILYPKIALKKEKE